MRRQEGVQRAFLPMTEGAVAQASPTASSFLSRSPTICRDTRRIVQQTTLAS